MTPTRDTDPNLPTWIVGADGSENARHAALWATAHAGGRASEVRLLAVRHDVTNVFYPGATALALRDGDMQRATEEYVHTLAEGLRTTTRVPITTAVATGGAARVLLDATTTDGMVIVGSRGRGGFARLVVGSTSTQVATHSSTPTAVIPLETDVGRAQRVVVAVDGSNNSLAAFDWAVEFAALDPARPPSIECVLASDGSTSEDLEQLVLGRLAIPEGPVDVTTRVVRGNVRHELMRAARDADLLVMGARGHGGIGAALLGSVSTWLLHHANVPMVIVPADAASVRPAS